MEYKKLLQEKEWKVKCYEILQRDNYTCQDCGCLGVHNETFIPISSLNNINNFFSNCVFNKKDLLTFCNNIQWRKQIISPITLNIEFFKEQLYIYTMSVHAIRNIFIFAAESKLSKIHFREYINNEIQLQYNGKDIKGELHAFLFEDDLGKTNYASVNYVNKNNKCEELKISILFDNKCYIFNFIYSNYSTNNTPFFKLIPLNIHHNYYVLNKKPWEYNDDALITLCSQCHQKRHLQKKTPMLTLNKQIYSPNLPLCDRCQGTGYLPQYHYYMGGICFKCLGEGVYDDNL